MALTRVWGRTVRQTPLRLLATVVSRVMRTTSAPTAMWLTVYLLRRALFSQTEWHPSWVLWPQIFRHCRLAFPSRARLAVQFLRCRRGRLGASRVVPTRLEV